ncbi:MAG: hypothetical protein HY744_01935 [Deltaproteobacteria bacterium]|nr:hypothetical protein [Deltaproteobacteria bacterium]
MGSFGSAVRWDGRGVRDERVSFFAHDLGAGAHAAEYLARASRSGELVWPAATAESMYDPRAYGRRAIEQLGSAVGGRRDGAGMCRGRRHGHRAGRW